MEFENNIQEPGKSKEDKCDQPSGKSRLPIMPNQEAILFTESVRRSPRAPPRVKVKFNEKFNDNLNEETGAKKLHVSAENTSLSGDASDLSSKPTVFSGSKEMDDGRKVDTYCWLCHGANRDDEEDIAYCIQCPRVFHFHCLGLAHRFNEEGMCPECKVTSLDGTNLKDSLTPENLANLLRYALDTMMKSSPLLKTFKYSEKQSQDLIFPVDLPNLLQKIEEKHYKTTASFFSDVKWMLHNMKILPSVARSLTTNAKKFVTECKSEMLDIEACPDCYQHIYSFDDNWFCKLCSVNHTLVWAKIKGFPFWPAKVLKVIDGLADVRFFGTHEKAPIKVPGNYCFLLSRESPNRKMPQNSLFKTALEELEIYTKRVSRKYGPIVYHPPETIYDPGPENICTKQVTRKRDSANSGSTQKSKKRKTAPVPLNDKTAVVELDRLRSITEVSSTPSPSNSSSKAKSVMKSVTKPQSLKTTKVSTNVATVNDVNDISVVEESGTTDKSPHKNATKLVGHNTISAQDTSTNHSVNSNGLPLPKVISTVNSAKKVVNSSCLVQGEENVDDSHHIEKTNQKRPEKVIGQQNSEVFACADSIDASNESSVGDFSMSITPEENSSNSSEVVELLSEVNGAHNQDETMAEVVNADNEDSIIIEENITPSSSLSGVREVHVVPEASSEQLVSGTGDEDVDHNVLLEFFPEEQEHQNEFAFDPAVNSVGSRSDENVESMQIQRPHSFSVQVPAHSDEVIESMIIQQPCLYCVQVNAFNEHPQEDRYECTHPLPEGFTVEKYSEKANPLFRAIVEEMWYDYINTPNVQKIVFALQKEMEELKAKHKKETEEVAKNTSFVISSLEKKIVEAVEAMRRKCEREKEEAIKEIKRKQWCMQCGKEARFYCCGNDSCCDHPCQKAHWLEHMASSAHTNADEEQQLPDSSDFNTQRYQVGSSSDNRLKKFSLNTWSKQQSRTSHTNVMSNKDQALPLYQFPNRHRSFSQSSAITPNSVAGVVPNSVTPKGNQSGAASNKIQVRPSYQLPTNPSPRPSHYSQSPVVNANNLPSGLLTQHQPDQENRAFMGYHRGKFPPFEKTRFAVSQTLHHIKGCPIPSALPRTSTLDALELLDAENKIWDNSMVELTYGPKKPDFQTLTEREVVAFDKKVLHFFGYLREEVHDWPSEKFRIRPVNIYYYLTDDTMEIVEPRVRNSGIPQGVLIKKHSFPHPSGNRYWHWRDFNIGMNISVYGKRFHLTNCDPWTAEYYLSSGIILNEEEHIPEDPYMKTRRLAREEIIPESPPIEQEKRYKFLNYDRCVLRFYGLWDDTFNEPSELRKVIVLFYLSDDTVEVQEVHRPNDGRDPYAVLIHRQKIPFNIDDLPPTFPRSVLETTNKEVKRYIGPSDLAIGNTIRILHRKVLLYDCDDYTKNYFRENYGMQDFTPVPIEEKPPQKIPLCIPPHSGFGTWEDSLQCCFSLRPEPAKKDVLKWLNFDDKFLRYLAHIDTVWPIDRSRSFVITFFPGDDTVSIREPSVPNSGIPYGIFMKRSRLRKGVGPGDKPQYYEAKDFYIGATIEASGRKFIITDADRYVLTFMEENYELYPESAFEAHRNKLVGTELQVQPKRSEKDELLAEMRAEVVKHCGEGETPLPETFDLGEGLVAKEMVTEKFYSANLPVSKDLLDRAMVLCTAPNGKIDVDELYKILEVSFGYTRDS